MVIPISCRLKSYTVHQIKYILTIKNPQNIEYLKRILNFKPECKPIDRISHGYSETKANYGDGFYQRDLYRYKKKKEEKVAMDKILLENITVSRLNQYMLSVKKEYIRSGEMSRCMLLFSDDQVFNYFQLK